MIANATRYIQRKGFKFIKIELEGQLDRSGCNHGNGHVCTRCDGTGIYRLDNCTCNDGYVTCPREYNDSYDDIEDCQNFIESYISKKANRLRVFGNFYNDGSVDSEYTFTLPCTTEGIKCAIEYIKAFKELGEAVGSGVKVSGAGMHIALLNDPAGSYESDGDHHNSLNYAYLSNFISQMKKLLPSLYFLGTCNAKTRPLEYRMPQVADEKYSAINCSNGVLEYRVFDPCYDRPEALLDYVEVIAKSLKFYAAMPILNLSKRLDFKIGYGNHIARMFMSPEQLEYLNETLPYLKPENKTIQQLKRERNFHLSIEKLKKLEQKKRARLLEEWTEYAKRFDELKGVENEAIADKFRDNFLGSIPSPEYIDHEIRQNFGSLQNQNNYIESKLNNQALEISVTI